MAHQSSKSGAAKNTFRMAQRHFARASAAFEQGDRAAAIRAAARTLRLIPDHLGAWELLARAHWRESAHERALAALERAIAINPYEPGYLYLQGLILQGMGRYGEAIGCMQRCIESEGSQVADSALAALNELESWQEELIAEAVRHDPEFRIRYAQDPAAACELRGFRFAQTDAKTRLARFEAAERALVWNRPADAGPA